LFSIQPEKVQEYYEKRNEVFNRKDAADELSKIVTRWATQKFADNPNSVGNLEEVWIYGMKGCDVMAGEDKELARMAKEQFLKAAYNSDELVGRLVNDIISVNSAVDARSKLEELLKVNPESEFIKLAIQTLGDDDGF
jgi:hypothetical protein